MRSSFAGTWFPLLPLLLLVGPLAGTSAAFSQEAGSLPAVSSYLVGDELVELAVLTSRISVGAVPLSVDGGGDESALDSLLVAHKARRGDAERSFSAHRMGRSMFNVQLDQPAFERRADLAAAAKLGQAGSQEKLARGEAGRRALANQAAVIAALRADDLVAWAYPALRHPASGTTLFPTPRLTLRTAPGASIESVVEALELEAGVRVELVRALRGSHDQFVVELSHPKRFHPIQVADQLRTLAGVQWAEPDFVQEWRQTGNNSPNDPYFAAQWHLENDGLIGVAGADARLDGAWGIQTGNTQTVVAIVDDGVQLSHPDFAGRIWENPNEIPGNGVDDDNNGLIDDINGWDFYEGDNDPNPEATGPSHGTSVAGVAAARGNNGLGVTGACQGCAILPVRIGGDSFASNAEIGEALRYAGRHADVVNGSWGGGAPNASINTALEDAATNGRSGKGTPVVFAAGNSATAYVNLALTGFPAGTYTFEWEFSKDSSVSAGEDAAFLDSVVFPGGELENFEDCSGLPSGWVSTGDANWTAVDNEMRANSTFGGRCAVRSGTIQDSETSKLRVTRTFPQGGDLSYSIWVSSEVAPFGVGPISQDDGEGAVECYDGVKLNLYDENDALLGNFFFLCGTYSPIGIPVSEGEVGYPASHSSVISIGAATNYDSRSSYSQWGPGLDIVAHSSGGTLGIWTTDVVGAEGYSDGDGDPSTGSTPDPLLDGDYTSLFGGTSAASPLAAGVVGLLLSEEPALTATEVRARLHSSARKIGGQTGRSDLYGHGALDAASLLGGGSGPAPLFADNFESGDTTAW